MIRLLLLTVSLLSVAVATMSAQDGAYIGTKSCAQCHDKQSTSFAKYSKKAHSWQSVARMKSKLKENEIKQCYECHTTGYGKRGGFVSIESTPDLADVGCETCHGPGGTHATSGDPKDIIRRPDAQSCTVCHNPQRIEDFNFKPLIYSGAH